MGCSEEYILLIWWRTCASRNLDISLLSRWSVCLLYRLLLRSRLISRFRENLSFLCNLVSTLLDDLVNFHSITVIKQLTLLNVKVLFLLSIEALNLVCLH